MTPSSNGIVMHTGTIIIIIIEIIIIKTEPSVQGRERVRTLYESEDPNPNY